MGARVETIAGIIKEQAEPESERLVLALYLIGTLLVVLPFLVYKWPLSTDYFAHLAWIKILLSPANSSLRRVFEIHFSVIPNLGLAIFAVCLKAVFSAKAILDFYSLIGITGVAVGVILLSRSINGRVQPTVLLVLPMLHSSTVAFGLYDFVFGIGLVLLLLTSLNYWRSFYRRVVVLNLCAPILFFVHLGALVCMGMVVLLRELELERPRWLAFALTPLYFVSTIPLYVLRTRPQSLHPIVFTNILQKLMALAGVFGSASVGIGALCAILMIAVVFFLIHSGLALAPDWRVPSLGLWTAAFIAPLFFEVSCYIDWRLFWFAALVTVAALQIPAKVSRQTAKVIFGVVSAIILLKLGVELRSFSSFNHDVAELGGALEPIPPGAPVFVASVSNSEFGNCRRPSEHREPQFYWHISALGIITGHGMDTMVFTQIGVVPVNPKPKFTGYFPDRPTVPPSAGLASYLFDHDASSALMQLLAKGNGAGDSGPDMLSYSLNWGQRYPFLIYLDLGCSEDPFAEKLQLVRHGSFFKIYRNPRVQMDALAKEPIPQLEVRTHSEM